MKERIMDLKKSIESRNLSREDVILELNSIIQQLEKEEKDMDKYLESQILYIEDRYTDKWVFGL